MSVDLNYGSIDEVRRIAVRNNTTTHPDAAITKALTTARSELNSLIHNVPYPPTDPDRELVDEIANMLAAGGILLVENQDDIELGTTIRRVAKDKIKSLAESRPAAVTQTYGVVGPPSRRVGYGYDKTNNKPYQSTY